MNVAPARTCECGECPKCKHREYMNGWYAKNAERHRETSIASRNRRIEYVREYDRARGNRSDLVKQRSRKALFDAIKRGEIEKGKCVFSDEGDCKGRIEGHHADYAKPLDVKWVCQHHHGRFHRTF